MTTIILADDHRAVGGTQEPTVQVPRQHVASQILQPHVRRDVSRGRTELGDDRSDVRRALGGFRTAGHADVHSAIVDAVGVAHRADQRIAVGQRGQPRQHVAHAQSGHSRGDRSVRTSNLLRRIGLGVKGVDVAAAAVLDDEDTRLIRLRALTRKLR